MERILYLCIRNQQAKFMRVLRKPVLALVIFLLMQGIVALLANWIVNPMTHTSLAVSLILSNLITILILQRIHMIRPSTLHPWRINWRYAHLGVIAVFLGIFAADLLSTILNLPNLMENEFMALARNPLGILAIVFIGPIAEEVVFRESILGYMLLHDVDRWKAILFSALLFGLIHFNPAQIPFAFIIGILLGIAYAKSRSILFTSFIHIINNGIAILEMNLLGESYSEFDIVNVLGGMPLTIIYIIACTILCIIFTREFMQKYHRPADNRRRRRR